MTCLPKQHLSLLLCFYIALQTLKGPLYSLWTNISNETPVKTAKSSHIVPNRKAEIKKYCMFLKAHFLPERPSHPCGVYESKTKSHWPTLFISSVWRRCFHNVLTVCNPISAQFCNKATLVFTRHLHMSFDFQKTNSISRLLMDHSSIWTKNAVEFYTPLIPQLLYYLYNLSPVLCTVLSCDAKTLNALIVQISCSGWWWNSCECIISQADVFEASLHLC